MLRAMPLQTERLLLRDLEPDDLDALAAMFADEEVMRWIGAGGVLGRDVAAGMIEREQRHYLERGWGQWATVERASGRMIGVCGLILWPAIGGREELEVAYLLARDAWGKGFATEAALAIRDYGVGIRPDLVSLIYPDNAASINVARKVGMRWEKEVRARGQHARSLPPQRLGRRGRLARDRLPRHRDPLDQARPADVARDRPARRRRSAASASARPSSPSSRSTAPVSCAGSQS